MAAHGYSQHIVRPHHMAGLGDLCPVQAHMTRFDQLSSGGALLNDPGKPEPLVQALRQLFLPII